MKDFTKSIVLPLIILLAIFLGISWGSTLALHYFEVFIAAQFGDLAGILSIVGVAVIIGFVIRKKKNKR
jgi:membrane protease YdiL (CAAX protease family)